MSWKVSRVVKKFPEPEPLAPRPNLDFSKGTRGKHVERMCEGTNLVLIAQDLVEAFPDSESVNEALRNLKQMAERSFNAR